MKIKFLTRYEAVKQFFTPDDYALKMPASNLKMVNPNNPTLEGYQSVFLDSFEDFTSEEKMTIVDFSETLFWLDFEVKIAKTKGYHGLDITQTRKDIILVSGGAINQPTFIHEVYHVLSRKYPRITDELAKMFNFYKVNEQVILDPNFLLNPDALYCDFAINVKYKAKNVGVVPFVGKGLSTGLKLLDKEEYVNCSLTNYRSLIPNTTYTAHVEEICAEHFSLVNIGRCIFQKELDEDKLIEFYFNIEKILKELNLLQANFPYYK